MKEGKLGKSPAAFRANYNLRKMLQSEINHHNKTYSMEH